MNINVTKRKKKIKRNSERAREWFEKLIKLQIKVCMCARNRMRLIMSIINNWLFSSLINCPLYFNARLISCQSIARTVFASCCHWTEMKLHNLNFECLQRHFFFCIATDRKDYSSLLFHIVGIFTLCIFLCWDRSEEQHVSHLNTAAFNKNEPTMEVFILFSGYFHYYAHFSLLCNMLSRIFLQTDPSHPTFSVRCRIRQRIISKVFKTAHFQPTLVVVVDK